MYFVNANGGYFWVAKISNIFGMLDIPDIFWGTVDAGSKPTYEEKKRVPPPWGSHWLINIFSIQTVNNNT